MKTTDQTGRPASRADDDDEQGEALPLSMADRIEDGTCSIAYQTLHNGVTLAFKVRRTSPTEAARAGALVTLLNRIIADNRTPDAEDVTGLQAAQADAAAGDEAARERAAAEFLEGCMRLVRSQAFKVRDLDDPTIWRPLVWVDNHSDAGDIDGRTHLCVDILDSVGLLSIAMAAVLPATEAAGQWGRFRR